MIKKIIMITSILLLICMSSYANNVRHLASTLHFDIPSNVSIIINNPSKAQLHYQCELHSFEINQIMFQSQKGSNRIDSITLNEGYQVYLEFPNRKEILIIIDIMGQLKLINRGNYSVTVDCFI